LRYVEHRLRVTLQDGRDIIGTFLAFDKHMNLVLSEAEEFRILRSSKGAVLEERLEKRNLGLVLIRGENVISLAVEGPPPPTMTAGIKVMPGGPGMARGIGRGTATAMGMPPVSTTGNNVRNAMQPPLGLGVAPVAGIGAPTGMYPPPPPSHLSMHLPPPPPPPPGMAGMPPSGMGRGMPPPY
jgi:small nuclear ribonucleoprotein B and B'